MRLDARDLHAADGWAPQAWRQFQSRLFPCGGIGMTNERRQARQKQLNHSSESENPERKYLYCVIRGKQARRFEVCGLAGTDHPIHTIHFDELAAVVSDAPEERYEST